jgi:hypothetical protein
MNVSLTGREIARALQARRDRVHIEADAHATNALVAACDRVALNRGNLRTVLAVPQGPVPCILRHFSAWVHRRLASGLLLRGTGLSSPQSLAPLLDVKQGRNLRPANC